MLLKFKTILFVAVLSATASQAQTTCKVAIPFRDKNLWGLSDTLGKIVVKPFAKEIKDFTINSTGKFDSRYVVKTNKTYYVIDRNKKVLLPELNTYDSIRLHSAYPDHFWVLKKGKVGLFHKNKEIIACQYDKVTPTYNDSYIVKKGKVCGLINSTGKLIIPIEYLDIDPSWKEEDEKNPKFVWVAQGMLVEKKFYDAKIIKNTDDDLISGIKVVEEAMPAKTSNNDIKSELLKKYDAVDINTYSSIATVTKKGKKGIVSLADEEEVISPKYDHIDYYGWDKDEKVYKVLLDGKYGLVKPRNISILDCEFDEILDNRVLIKDNKKGMIVLNTIYPYIKPKYLDIKSRDGIQINDHWQFGLFEVVTENGKGLVGENGVEFFKN